jgi:hypothetical protein
MGLVAGEFTAGSVWRSFRHNFMVVRADFHPEATSWGWPAVMVNVLISSMTFKLVQGRRGEHYIILLIDTYISMGSN